MKLTKKDFIKVSRIIGNSAKEPHNGSDRIAVLVDLIQQFSILFADTNPKFDKEFFKEACWEAYRS